MNRRTPTTAPDKLLPWLGSPSNCIFWSRYAPTLQVSMLLRVNSFPYHCPPSVGQCYSTHSHNFFWSLFPLLDRHLLPLRVPRLFASTDLSSRLWWYNPRTDKLAWGLRISQVEIDFVDLESGRFSPRDRLSGDLDCRFTFTSVARRQVFMNVIKVVFGPRGPLVLPSMDLFVHPREFSPLLLLVLPLLLPLHARHPHYPRHPCHPRNPPHPRQPSHPCHYW